MVSVDQTALILASAAAYFSGRGYYVSTRCPVPESNSLIDAAAVMPRMRELKLRFKKGFAPTGIINHMLGVDWIQFHELVEKTGYETHVVGAILDDASREGWVEIDFREEGPRCRIKDYRVPARECILAFVGTENLAVKLDVLRSVEGCYNQALFIFPYQLDNDTTELIASTGAGITRYYQNQGIFQELVPPEAFDIQDQRRFSLLVEKVLYEHSWIMTDETI
jgi:hypothetical protein